MCFFRPSTSITLPPRRSPLGMMICAVETRSRTDLSAISLYLVIRAFCLACRALAPARIQLSSFSSTFCLALSSRASCSRRLAFCSSQAE